MPQSRQRSRNVSGKGRFDSALINAKGMKQQIELGLAVEDPICDNKEEMIANVTILEVDTYSVKVKSIRSGREAWISKAFIVSAMFK